MATTLEQMHQLNVWNPKVEDSEHSFFPKFGFHLAMEMIQILEGRMDGKSCIDNILHKQFLA